MSKAFVYIATSSDGLAKLVQVFGTAQTLDQLRSTSLQLVDVDPIMIELGANHNEIVAGFSEIMGVTKVETPSDDAALQGDPLDGEYLIYVADPGYWETVLPSIRNVLAKHLDGASLSVEDYTVHG